MPKTDQKIRTTFSVPMPHWKVLVLWAWLKGRSPITLASDIVQARCEDKDNLQWIDINLKDRANDLKMSVEELRDDIIEEYFSRK